MHNKRPVIAVDHYLSPAELNNEVFTSKCNTGVAGKLKKFRAFMNVRGVEVVTIDTVDFADPNVKYVIYFDYNWRLIFSDPYLRQIPREKRVLTLLEPANINPSLYYLPFLRNTFHTVFTFDLNLIRKNPTYTRINVPLGAEPNKYLVNPFRNMSFADKRLLVAVSMNRWSYMPQSTYSIRKLAYRHFERAFPEQFDLYGFGWNAPSIFYERWFGHPIFPSWRGPIDNTYEAKVQKIAAYKFALCFENNASEPGYISEKITDCLCARCVPIYYGSKGTDELIPRDAWIDLRDFRNFAELGNFLSSMNEERYNQYIAAIDQFMESKKLNFFSTDHFCGTIANVLGF